MHAQSKLFPTFFGLNSAMALVALATLHFSGVGALRPQQISLGALMSIHLCRYFWTCQARTVQTVVVSTEDDTYRSDHGAGGSFVTRSGMARGRGLVSDDAEFQFGLRPGTASGILRVGVALAGSVLQLVALEPHTTNIMLQRYELENAGGQRDNDRIAALKSSFGKWCVCLLV